MTRVLGPGQSALKSVDCRGQTASVVRHEPGRNLRQGPVADALIRSVLLKEAMPVIDPCVSAALPTVMDTQRSGQLTSGLTEAGAAGEIAFVWPGNDVRLTVDPMPDGRPEQRLKACRSAMAADLRTDQASTLRILQQWLEASPVRYGGWLGLRPKGGGCAGKLYVEVPRDAPFTEWEHTWAGSEAVLRKREARPVMVGLDPGRPGIEIYQRLNGLCRHGLVLLLRRFGFEDRTGDVIDVLERLTERMVRREFPSDDPGFSVVFSDYGKPEILTIYSVSEALLGPASRARAALLAYGKSQGWSMDDYALLSAADRDGQYPHHGLVGIVLAPGRPLAVSATLAVDMRSTS